MREIFARDQNICLCYESHMITIGTGLDIERKNLLPYSNICNFKVNLKTHRRSIIKQSWKVSSIGKQFSKTVSQASTNDAIP